jgi:FtsZ-binding cell division protein ZapB
MNRFSRAFTIAFLAVFGLWGCSRTPSNPTVSVEKVRSLEENLKSTVEVRDQLATKLKMIETRSLSLQQELDKLKSELKETTRERDDAQAMMRVRTAERDLSQSQYEGFRKSLKDLIGQAEVSLTPNKGNDQGMIVGPALFSSPMVAQ